MSVRSDRLRERVRALASEDLCPEAFIDLLRARGGRFAEYWVSSDGLALMAQLGALGPGG
jgi:hypothetical protein